MQQDWIVLSDWMLVALVKESILFTDLRYCYHQLNPCYPDKALRYCWTLHE